MNIFQLMLLACVGMGDNDQVSISVCQWVPHGLYATRKACSRQGAVQLGKPLDDSFHKRKVEGTRCDYVWVFSR